VSALDPPILDSAALLAKAKNDTGLSDWGYWFQGELLGEWVLPNSNLRSHMVRLELTPNDVFTFNLLA